MQASEPTLLVDPVMLADDDSDDYEYEYHDTETEVRPRPPLFVISRFYTLIPTYIHTHTRTHT